LLWHTRNFLNIVKIYEDPDVKVRYIIKHVFGYRYMPLGGGVNHLNFGKFNIALPL
jgi:hypothetical protein